jgi:hypothetical protein
MENDVALNMTSKKFPPDKEPFELSDIFSSVINNGFKYAPSTSNSTIEK